MFSETEELKSGGKGRAGRTSCGIAVCLSSKHFFPINSSLYNRVFAVYIHFPRNIICGRHFNDGSFHQKSTYILRRDNVHWRRSRCSHTHQSISPFFKQLTICKIRSLQKSTRGPACIKICRLVILKKPSHVLFVDLGHSRKCSARADL